MSAPIYVLTARHRLWLMDGFDYLFKAFWPGATYQALVMDGPPQTFGHVLRKFLIDTSGDGDLCILMLDDFWLYKPTDQILVKAAVDAMRERTDAIRCDLSGDRLIYATPDQSSPVAVCDNAARYSINLQTAVWRRGPFWEDLCRPDESPQDLEHYGTKKLQAGRGTVGNTFVWSTLTTRPRAVFYSACYGVRPDTECASLPAALPAAVYDGLLSTGAVLPWQNL